MAGTFTKDTLPKDTQDRPFLLAMHGDLAIDLKVQRT